jgi:hypothetical protein
MTRPKPLRSRIVFVPRRWDGVGQFRFVDVRELYARSLVRLSSLKETATCNLNQDWLEQIGSTFISKPLIIGCRPLKNRSSMLRPLGGLLLLLTGGAENTARSPKEIRTAILIKSVGSLARQIRPKRPVRALQGCPILNDA